MSVAHFTYIGNSVLTWVPYAIHEGSLGEQDGLYLLEHGKNQAWCSEAEPIR